MLTKDAANDGILDSGSNTWDANSKRIVNVADRIGAQDAATKAYGDANWGGASATNAAASAVAAAATAASVGAAETNAAASASASAASAASAATTLSTVQSSLLSTGQSSFAALNGLDYINSLKVTSGTYTDTYRSYGAAYVSWYFMLSAMVLSDAFSEAEIKAAVETALDVGVVGPWEASSTYVNPTKVIISGKVFFCNIGGTTGATIPNVTGATTKGSFIGDGTVTWEYLGPAAYGAGSTDLPSSWQFFMVDIKSDLNGIQAPDSTDAYAGVLLAAAQKANVDATWLSVASKFPGKDRMDLLAAVAKNSITDEVINGSLSNTFQSDVLPDGSAHGISYLADNVEAWRGMVALAALHTTAGEGANATQATTDAGTIRTGVVELWDATTGRFKTHRDDLDHGSITGDSAFVTDFRFHLWPLLHGMWTSQSDITTYVDPVVGYTLANVPGLWTADMDSFVMGEWFYVTADTLGWVRALDTYRARLNKRAPAAVTITDAALGHSLSRQKAPLASPALTGTPTIDRFGSI